MNEELLAGYWHGLSEQLMVLKREEAWKRDFDTFHGYAAVRWSLDRTMTNRLLRFFLFTKMAKEERLPTPDSPHNIAPILVLAQKRWMGIWRICLDTAKDAVNADHCKSVIGLHGEGKRPPPKDVRDRMRLKAATKSLAGIEDVESLDQVGREWEQAIQNAIEIDQNRLNRERSSG